MPSLFGSKEGNAPKRLAERKPVTKAKKVVVAIIAVLVLCFAGGSAWALYSYDLVYPGVRAGTVDASGMDRETLVSKLRDENARLYQGKSLNLTVQGIDYTVTSEEIGAKINEESAADAVIAYGRTGSYFKRLSDLIGAVFHGADVDILTFDNEALKKKSELIANDFMKRIQTSEYEVKDNKLILYLANKSTVISPDTVYNALFERLREADFAPLLIEPEHKEVLTPDLDAICKEVETEPQNAKLDLEKDPTGKTILPSIDGVKLDREEAERLLGNRGEATEVEIPVTVTKPEVTTEKLQEVLFRDVIADVTTSLNPSLKSRTGNVKLAADYMNGRILNPGDEFSYNAVVGERTVERGFQDAKIFENGEIVDGLGGGICQVSSTTYMAALRADLKITERRNHQFTVTYAPLGQDATVVYGSTDFRFVNNTAYPIRVESFQKGNGITVKLIGTKTENKEVKLVTNVLSKTPYESRTVVDPSLKPDQKVVESEGHTGYKTETYRVVYIDGKEVRREPENKSTYKKLDFVVRTGQGDQAASGDTTGEIVTETPPKDVEMPEADPVLGPDLDAPEEPGQPEEAGKPEEAEKPEEPGQDNGGEQRP